VNPTFLLYPGIKFVPEMSAAPGDFYLFSRSRRYSMLVWSSCVIERHVERIDSVQRGVERFKAIQRCVERSKPWSILSKGVMCWEWPAHLRNSSLITFYTRKLL
jgi:hypothetical protein